MDGADGGGVPINPPKDPIIPGGSRPPYIRLAVFSILNKKQCHAFESTLFMSGVQLGDVMGIAKTS